MKTNLIKAIFTNLLFVIGVILLIFGFVKGSITIAYIAIFDKYPLDQYQETMCDNNYSIRSMDKTEALPSMQENDLTEAKLNCQKQTERQRNVNKATDVVASFTTLISGVALVYFFRRFIFGKNS